MKLSAQAFLVSKTYTFKREENLMTYLDKKMAKAKTKCLQISRHQIGQPQLSENNSVSYWDVCICEDKGNAV